MKKEVINDPNIQIVHKVCAGIDVHKNKFFVTIGTTLDNGSVEYVRKVWETPFYDDFEEIKAWLHEYNCFDVCFEATGKYWIPLYDVLSDSCNVVVTNAYHIKAINGKKSDKIDSQRICYLFKYGLIKNSFIQTPEITKIRNLFRYRRKIVDTKRSETQRLIDVLVVSCVRLSTVFTDVLGVSCMGILKYMIENPKDTEFDVKPFLHGKCKASVSDVQKAIKGGFNGFEIFMLKEILNTIEFYDKKIDILDKEIDRLINELPNIDEIIQTLKTLPKGVGDQFIKAFITEVGIDVDAWDTVDKFISWLGLAPGKNESAGKVKKSNITPSNKYLKPVLIQVVLGFIKSKEDTYFKFKYYQLKKRIGGKRALIAVGRMLMRSIYFMIKNKEPFDKEKHQLLLEKTTGVINKPKTKQTTTDEILIKLLKERGYEITKKELSLSEITQTN